MTDELDFLVSILDETIAQISELNRRVKELEERIKGLEASGLLHSLESRRAISVLDISPELSYDTRKDIDRAVEAILQLGRNTPYLNR